MKFWYKKRQFMLFKRQSVWNQGYMASLSKSLTESGISGWWPCTSTVEYFTNCGVEVTFILLTIRARQGEALNSTNEVHQLVWIKCLSRYQKNRFLLLIVEWFIFVCIIRKLEVGASKYNTLDICIFLNSKF